MKKDNSKRSKVLCWVINLIFEHLATPASISYRANFPASESTRFILLPISRSHRLVPARSGSYRIAAPAFINICFQLQSDLAPAAACHEYTHVTKEMKIIHL